jgi:actin-like protein 6A
MYCGDETGSFIGEIGSHNCRFGYGGEDNPKLTMPSYIVSGSSNESDGSRQIRRMSRFSSLHPPREEEVMESILRMPHSSSSSSNEHEPLVDPNCFLKQGEIVENWDNVQTAWEYSMDVLRATDTLKHTQGGTPYDRSKKQQKREHSSGLSSVSVMSKEDEGSKNERGRGRCVHPMLAITPGVSEYTSSASSSASDDNTNNTGPKFQAAIRRQQHTKHIEMLMESLDATSAFLAPAPMMAAFSLGRQTALVVDIGAGGCRVTPIVDGLILKQSQRRSGRGGDWLGDVTWKALLEEKAKQESASASSSSPEALSPTTNATTGIKPRYMLKNRYEGKKPLSTVFHKRAMNDLMYEIRTEPFVTLQSMDNSGKIRIPFTDKSKSKRNPKPSLVGDGDVVMASPPGTPNAGVAKNTNTNTNTPTNAAKNENQNNPPWSPGSIGTTMGDNSGCEPAIYELPDGTPIDLTSSSFGKDLCRLPELLFAAESALPFRQFCGSSSSFSSQQATTSTLSNLPLHKLIKESLLAVGDVDVRKELAGCICLVGATSLFPNLEKRLSQELTALLPSFVRPKVVAPKISSVERSCASWIGASILTSLGSFQQLWLSRTEYEEYGAALSIQRFP